MGGGILFRILWMGGAFNESWTPWDWFNDLCVTQVGISSYPTHSNGCIHLGITRPKVGIHKAVRISPYFLTTRNKWKYQTAFNNLLQIIERGREKKNEWKNSLTPLDQSKLLLDLDKLQNVSSSPALLLECREPGGYGCPEPAPAGSCLIPFQGSHRLRRSLLVCPRGSRSGTLPPWNLMGVSPHTGESWTEAGLHESLSVTCTHTHTHIHTHTPLLHSVHTKT